MLKEQRAHEPGSCRAEASPKCFMHIPKSAGSSMHAALETALPPGSLAPQRFDRSVFCAFDAFDRLSTEIRSRIAANSSEIDALNGYDAVSGHFALPTLLRITDAWSIATVLREPRARLLSLYTYWRNPDISSLWAPYSANLHAFRPMWEFLSEPSVAPMTDNQLCRMLLYGDPRLPDSDFIAQADIDSIAANAIERLDSLGFVGVLELGDCVWDGVGALFDVTLTPTTTNVTQAVPRPTGTLGDHPLAHGAIELIEQRNAADLLVYDHALALAGLRTDERNALRERAFFHQLVKLGDLAGRSAARAHEHAQGWHTEGIDYQAWRQEATATYEATMREHHETICGLEADLAHRDDDIERLRRCLTATHASVSWRMTSPLRAAKRMTQHILTAFHDTSIGAPEQSLLAEWSVNQVWAFALMLCVIIAATDAILSHVVLIAVLTAGPSCSALTGRWLRTAVVGIWAFTLAIPLGVADSVWDTRTQLVNLTAVATVALLSTLAATFAERRYGHGAGR